MSSIEASIQAVIQGVIKDELPEIIKSTLGKIDIGLSDECLIDLQTVSDWTGMSKTFLKDPKNKVPHYRFGDAWRFKPSEIRSYIEGNKAITEAKRPQIRVVKSKTMKLGGI